MKKLKNIIKTLVLLIIGCAIGYGICEHKYHKFYSVYTNYFSTTEVFLDTLDSYYDWVNDFNPVEYNKACQQVDSINKQLYFHI